MSDHSNIAAAFVKAQAQFTHVVTARQGQARAAKFAYADLSDLVEMARPILAAHSLAFQSHNSHADGGVLVFTRLVHASGEWMEDRGTFIPVPADAGAQSVGSALTYGRRYGLLAMLGIATDDDDGAAAMQAQAAKIEKAQKLAAAPRVDGEQAAILTAIARAARPGSTPDLSDKLAEDFEAHVQAFLAFAVKEGKVDAADADHVKAAALKVDVPGVAKLLAGGVAA